MRDARAQAAVPVHAQQPDRDAGRPRRRPRASPPRLPDTIVVADEAYGEFADEPSLAAEAAIRQPRRPAHSVESLWPGRRADRLRDRRRRTDRADRAGLAALSAARSRASPPRSTRSGPSGCRSTAQRIAELLADARAARRRSCATSPRSCRSAQGGNFLFLEVADPAGLARRLAAAAVRVRFRPARRAGRGARHASARRARMPRCSRCSGSPRTTASRRADVVRDTKETRIALSVDLDRDRPRADRQRHPLLRPYARPGRGAWRLRADPGLQRRHDIDPHHSIEDIAIALGNALAPGARRQARDRPLRLRAADGREPRRRC